MRDYSNMFPSFLTGDEPVAGERRIYHADTEETNVQTIAHMLTDAQQDTVNYFTSVARETGATIEVSNDEYGTYIIETASAEWDNERTMWRLNPDGVAHIL